jgi:uncharacterized FAD-dependent dehydrogenase
MPHLISLMLTPREAFDMEYFREALLRETGVSWSDIQGIRIIKRSIDARKRNIKVHVQAELFVGEPFPGYVSYKPAYKNVAAAEPLIIAGAGPAGLFAALTMLEHGKKPVIIERGREVSERKKDVAMISRKHVVDADSNYCFGEGGAGTFSDGKLYTRSKKRGEVRKVLEILCYHGAPESILYDSHPHIGTDLLPRIIRNIRNTLLEAGAEIHFNTRLTDILVINGAVRGVLTQKGDKLLSSSLILATGHSARDIYELFNNKGWRMESKGFAMGVRVEHPQSLIDSIQYHRSDRGCWLPASSYQLSARVGKRGVYSFCMCPGGFIVPSATDQEEVVVNGMSSSHRNSSWANSGIVVEIHPDDAKPFERYGMFAGLRFQQSLERLAWEMGGQRQTAPAQRLTDFVERRFSGSLPSSSYFPGVISSPLHEWLPSLLREALIEGFQHFGRIMKGYYTHEAIILGVESRTSSPLRIPRDENTWQHPQVRGLFPAGEGAGYAGGIVSSAIDGMNCAERACQQ